MIRATDGHRVPERQVFFSAILRVPAQQFLSERLMSTRTVRNRRMAAGHRDDFLDVRMVPQPNDVTCGPTSLHAVYDFHGRPVDLTHLITRIGSLPDGGTLAVFLGIDALARGFSATLYTYDLKVFDPTWAGLDGEALIAKLGAQRRYKKGKRFNASSEAYMEFINGGGRVAFDDLTPDLLDHVFDRQLPILTGLNATYLYGTRREYTDRHDLAHADDLRGHAVGHFVVLCGRRGDLVRVADPFYDNPLGEGHYYDVDVDRLIRAILLGAITYDANLLVISEGAKA
jgi:hypothetical protein